MDRLVIEYDSQGKECSAARGVPGRPTGAGRKSLLNGRTLVALSDGNQIVELDRDGDIVWKLACWPANDGGATSNGNTLVNLGVAKKVVEVDPWGVVRWGVAGLQKPHTAQASQQWQCPGAYDSTMPRQPI